MTDTAKLEALKACKRCGANDYSIMAPGGMWHVECQDCGYITSGACSTQAEAITAWNTRALPVSRPAVNGLEWHKSNVSDSRWTAAHPFGAYEIVLNKRDAEYWSPNFIGSGRHWRSLKEAQSAIAALHTSAVLSALSSLSPPTGGWKLVGYLKPQHPAAVEPFFIDAAARTEDWQKSVFTQPVYAPPLPSPPEAE